MRVDRNELAWAAGFFDGEGWANALAAEGRRTRQPHARVNQAGSDGTPEVLLRFQTAVGGLGFVGGPYVVDGRRDLYKWEISSRGDVELLHHLLRPWLGQLKLGQLGTALGRPAARSRPIGSTDDWICWAAGLWDGEGSTYLLDHRSHDGYLIAEARVTQASRCGSPEVLERFRDLVHVGRIYGPYQQVEHHQPVYRWHASATSDVLKVIELLLGRVGSVKAAQARNVAVALGSQPPLPRGRPEWGNRKSHCIRGHEYASSRLRPYRSRGKNEPPRDSHQCLVCAREQAKARRDKKRTSATDG